jgi:xylulokinase
MQAISDTSQVDQFVCEKTVGASYGDAFLARVALGEAKLADIGHWNPIATQITAAQDPAYEKNYALFRRLYEQTKDIAKELSS